MVKIKKKPPPRKGRRPVVVVTGNDKLKSIVQTTKKLSHDWQSVSTPVIIFLPCPPAGRG